jgi:hypothetical protein
MEAKTLRTNIAIVTTNVLFECILTKFGCPSTIITVMEFISLMMLLGI